MFDDLLSWVLKFGWELAVIIAGLVVTALVHRSYRAAGQRKREAAVLPYAGSEYSLLFCQLEGDPRNDLIDEVQALFERRNVTGIATRQYPRVIPYGADGETRKQSDKDAGELLKRLRYDFVVWGKRSDGESKALLRIVSNLRPTAASKAFHVERGSSDSTLASEVMKAVVGEINAAVDDVCSNPKSVGTDVLRRLSQQSASLIQGGMEDIPPQSQQVFRTRFDLLQLELSRQAARVEEWDLAVSNATFRLREEDKEANPAAWAKVAVGLATHIRRRAWAGCERDLVEQGIACATDAYALTDEQSIRIDAAVQALWLTRNLQIGWDAEKDTPAVWEARLVDFHKSSDHPTQQAILRALVGNGAFDSVIAIVGDVQSGWASKTWDACGRFSGDISIDDGVFSSIPSLLIASYEPGRSALPREAVTFLEELRYRTHTDALTQACLNLSLSITTTTVFNELPIRDELSSDDRLASAESVVAMARRADLFFSDQHAAPSLQISAKSALAYALQNSSYAYHHGETALIEATQAADEATQIASARLPGRLLEANMEAARTRNNWSTFFGKLDPARQAISMLSNYESLPERGYYVLAYAKYAFTAAVVHEIETGGSPGSDDIALAADYIEQAEIDANVILSSTEDHALRISTEQLLGYTLDTRRALDAANTAKRKEKHENLA